ncbi:MAG TPA: BlaI/MecI/CopY family transcriptional regulator [Steroidobacteraceae bacterium]|nr:BlaI/MecI/CopY family transcriptional regulator [Steroidobacteraceae bacterium]
MATRKSKVPEITISEAESLVMQAIWDRGPLPTEDIVTAVRHAKWGDSTVKTLLNRLLNKGALSAKKDNRRYVYSAVLTREAWLASESHGFLERVFGGRVAPLVSYFSQQKKLAKDDIEELKRIIRELDDDR